MTKKNLFTSELNWREVTTAKFLQSKKLNFVEKETQAYLVFGDVLRFLSLSGLINKNVHN